MSSCFPVAAFVPLYIGVLATGAAGQSSRRPPPLEVRSSSPTEGQTDVRLEAIVRIEFSSAADPRSFEKRIRMSYSREESAERGEAQPPSIAFETRYERDRYVLELLPRRPLERFRKVAIELLDGIAGADGSELRRWRLNFSTGGS